MFLDNKYSRTYWRLIDVARSRPEPDRSKAGRAAAYFEEHHIIPKALGGVDDKSNLVFFTAREHFVAHLLLPKMTDGLAKSKMQMALGKMLVVPKKMQGLRYVPTGRTFEIARRAAADGHRGNKEIANKISKARLGTKATIQTRQKLSEQRKGKKLNLSDEQRAIRSERQKNRSFSIEHREKLKLAWIARRERKAAGLEPRKPMSEQARSNISIAKKGKPASEEQKRKNSESHRSLWKNEDYRQKIISAQRTAHHLNKLQRIGLIK